MLFASFTKAIHNLLLPEIIKIFLLCMLAYIAGWGVLSFALSKLITYYVGFAGAEGFFMSAVSAMGGGVIAWFFFPLLYPILISFFDDKIAEAIEQEDYPLLPAAKPPFWPTIANDIMFSLKAVGLNIIFLPFYIIPVLGIVIYYGLNGYLLGAQFFRMAAGRRITKPQAVQLQKKAGGTILLIGVAISFFSTIPVLNLAAPTLGVATMIHLLHELLGNNKQRILPPS